jgi:DNA-binding transcriptional MerR regulator
MRMTELSARSGLSIPTIKYYKRRGLLPPGRATYRNQIDYAPAHVERLRLIRVLTEVVGLTLDGVRALLEVIDDPARGSADVLVTAQDLVPLGGAGLSHDDEAWRHVRGRLSTFLTARAWRVRPDATALDDATDVLAALRLLGHELRPDVLAEYAQLAKATVAAEMRLIPVQPRSAAVRTILKLTTINENLFGALRRLAREDLYSRSTQFVTQNWPDVVNGEHPDARNHRPLDLEGEDYPAARTSSG